MSKAVLGPKAEAAGVFTETPDQMVRRVCRALGTKRNIVVLNDEAHHCYRRRPAGSTVAGADDETATTVEDLKGEDEAEAAKRDEDARVWASGLEAVAAKIGIRVVYDLSATPFFLQGSGYPEASLFPWAPCPPCSPPAEERRHHAPSRSSALLTPTVARWPSKARRTGATGFCMSPRGAGWRGGR